MYVIFKKYLTNILVILAGDYHSGICISHGPPKKEIIFYQENMYILGCPKCLFRFFCQMLRKNPNELIGQHNIFIERI